MLQRAQQCDRQLQQAADESAGENLIKLKRRRFDSALALQGVRAQLALLESTGAHTPAAPLAKLEAALLRNDMSAVVDVTREHPRAPVVQGCGCAALSRLACSDARPDDAAVLLRALDAALFVLREHHASDVPRDGHLLTAALQTLHNVMIVPWASPFGTLMRRFARENGVHQLLAKFLRARSVSKYKGPFFGPCLELIKVLLSTDEDKACAFRADWLPLLIGVLDSGCASLDTIIDAARLLASLLCLPAPRELGVACRLAALKAGALEALIKALRSQDDDEFFKTCIINDACLAFAVLVEAGGDAAVERATGLDAIDHIAERMRLHAAALGTPSSNARLALCAMTRGGSAAASKAAEYAVYEDALDLLAGMRDAASGRISDPVLGDALAAELLSALEAARESITKRTAEFAVRFAARRRAADDAMAALLAEEEAAESAARGTTAAATSKKAKKKAAAAKKKRAAATQAAAEPEAASGDAPAEAAGVTPPAPPPPPPSTASPLLPPPPPPPPQAPPPSPPAPPAALPSRCAPRPYLPPTDTLPVASCAAETPAAGALPPLPPLLAALMLKAGAPAAAQAAPPTMLFAPAAPPSPPPPLPSRAIKECVICWADVPIDELLLLWPCAHRCLCSACADDLLACSAPRCPKCRVAVAGASRVYEN